MSVKLTPRRAKQYTMSAALRRAREAASDEVVDMYDLGIAWAVQRLHAKLEGRAATIRRLLSTAPPDSD